MRVVINLFRVFMADAAMFQWFAFTNVLAAVGPGWLWAERGTARGTSEGLAIWIVIGTLLTFLPPGWGMWTTALPWFDQPWFYLTGVVACAYAVYNWLLVRRLKRQPH